MEDSKAFLGEARGGRELRIPWRPGGMCGAQLNQKLRKSCGKKLWGLDNLKHANLKYRRPTFLELGDLW